MTPVIVLSLLADIGIPMIFLTLPLMLMLLLPVIAVEAYFYRRWLDLTKWQATKCSAVSNLVSTLIDIALAWGIMVGVEFGTMGLTDGNHYVRTWKSPIADLVLFFLSSAWIAPVEGMREWLIPAATLSLLVPFFFTSYAMEYLILKFMVGMPDGGPPSLSYFRVRLAVRNVNLVTYAALFLSAAIWLVFSLPHH
jgi:hypothetical protein